MDCIADYNFVKQFGISNRLQFVHNFQHGKARLQLA